MIVSVAKAASKSVSDNSYMYAGTGGTAAVYGGVSQNTIALVIGVVCTVLTLCVTFYYKRKEDIRREREEQRKEALFELKTKGLLG